MKTAVASGHGPHFDMRACPIWAIPQLAQLRDRLAYIGLVIHVFEVDLETQGTPEACGAVTLWIPDEGYYRGLLYKKNMNEHCMPMLWLV